MASTPLVAWMNPLPMELAPALGARRNLIAATATGRVLDLGGWSDHLGSYRIGDTVDEVVMLVRPGDLRGGDADSDPSGLTRLDAGFDSLVDLGVERFDTIVSLVRMPLIADLDRLIANVLMLLNDEGQFLFLEPVGRTGRIGRILALGGSVVRATGGLHLDRDIPAALRTAGMIVTDLERFDVATVSAPFRPFIDGRCRRPFSPAR